MYTYTAESAVAEHRQQRMNVAFTREIKPSLHVPMWRGHSLRISTSTSSTVTDNVHINKRVTLNNASDYRANRLLSAT